ncbi:hypothetical protein LTR92_011518 [Exophiala xenobiotica]|nr:hypothetical protein LTR92_011518 [Exophiala xenobiotica]KAK5431427.1 hypothetical protein LTR18_011367 [Exophiala xenobiotica]KAK5463854.1 hypothetical protein LTR55_011755 [Exophiala xenobiotica]
MLCETSLARVEFPDEDESSGEIDIHFLGPVYSNFLSAAALNVALLYLSSSPAAVLDHTLVEREQLASNVYYEIVNRPRLEIIFMLTGVKSSRLEEAQTRFFGILNEVMDNPLNMADIKNCIESLLRSRALDAEDSPVPFVECIIADHLYGKNDGSTLYHIESLVRYANILMSWSAQQWKEFIKLHISDAHHVTIHGVPSARLSEVLKGRRLTESRNGENG